LFGNWLKTLTERDSARLRRLESLVLELTDDVTKCLELADRINARLRQRAKRSVADPNERDDGPADDTADHQHGDGRDRSGFPPLAPVTEGTVGRPMRDSLRERARARGLLPQGKTGWASASVDWFAVLLAWVRESW
jgi:hypothetical protein